MASIPPLGRRPRTVSAELAAHLEGLIVSGELKPGDRLPPERELAVSLGTSRASLREAMFELESKGLVIRKHGNGTIVAERPAELEDLYDRLSGLDVELSNIVELRDLVEPRIASLAAFRAADSNLVTLDDILTRSRARLSAEESLALDIEFHTSLAVAAQNPLLLALSEMTGEWTRALRSRSHATPHGRRVSLLGHQRIYEAVRARDGVHAAAEMELHIREIRDVIAETLLGA